MVTLPRVALATQRFHRECDKQLLGKRERALQRELQPERNRLARNGQRDLLGVVDDEQRAAYGSDGGVRAGGQWRGERELDGARALRDERRHIASYTVSASGGGSQTCTTTATSCTVNGLTNGVSYTLSVSATTNSLATGAAASVTALPVLPPPTTDQRADQLLGAPTSVNASPTVPVTISQISGGASAAVTVPAGALPSGTTVSVYPVIDAAPLVRRFPRASPTWSRWSWPGRRRTARRRWPRRRSRCR